MALYKYSHYISQTDSDEFDKVYHPGASTPFSGVYRCTGCGREDVSVENKPLPPQNHHQHTIDQGLIRWKMVVYADHKPK